MTTVPAQPADLNADPAGFVTIVRENIRAYGNRRSLDRKSVV